MSSNDGNGWREPPEWAAMRARMDKRTPDPLADSFRATVETALAQHEVVVAALQDLLEGGWPSDDEDLPIISNWTKEKSRLPCLEGNIVGTAESATIRSRTPPLILQDTAHGLALTMDGWYRTEQQLVVDD